MFVDGKQSVIEGLVMEGVHTKSVAWIETFRRILRTGGPFLNVAGLKHSQALHPGDAAPVIISLEDA